MRTFVGRRGLVYAVLVCVLFSASNALAQASTSVEPRRIAILASITGVIGPATALYVEKTIETAQSRHAEIVILRLDTPGGLLTSTREIIQAILASNVPVIGYVSPAGAHAASAGTYILYATDIAAMAPGTNIGAATPVQIGGDIPGFVAPDKQHESEPRISGEQAKEEKNAPAQKSTLETKSINDAVALIRSLAELRGRNAEWAEKAVREAATLDARQALEEHVIDLIATDVDDLLRALNGRTATIGKQKRTLATEGIEVERAEPDFIIKALGVLANPNIALILMLAGIYGLIFEFMSPGAVLPGVVGAISLVLGLFALSELPIDYAGLALLLLGIVFMIAEAFMPTFGALGFGGIFAFVVGALFLVKTDVPAFRVSYGVITGTALVSGAFFIILVGYLWRSQWRKAVSGAEQLIGSEAVVLDWKDGEGYVWAQGERWHARGESGFAPGDKLIIQGRDGLTLNVMSSKSGASRKK